MPPKLNTRKSKRKKSQYAFPVRCTDWYHKSAKLLSVKWHSMLCRSEYPYHPYAYHRRLQLHLYTHPLVDSAGTMDIAKYICVSPYCRCAVYLHVDKYDVFLRLKNAVTGCIRQWRKFKKRRQVSVRTELLHHSCMIPDIIDVILEYMDTCGTQHTGKRLQENIALPCQSSHSVN